MLPAPLLDAAPRANDAGSAPRLRGDRLRLTEIFLSVQGEADAAGWPTVFVRLTGCPLRCTWCDTAYAFHGGQWWTIEAILADGLPVRFQLQLHKLLWGEESGR